MSSRSNILTRIRAAYGRQGEAPAEMREAARAYIGARAQGPRPKSDWDPIERFRERVVALASTLDEVETLASVPDAVARYLQRNGLPPEAVCWAELTELDWASRGIRVEARRAQGADRVGITGCACAIAETGTLMLLSGAATASSVSLVPETHIAIVRTGEIVKGMEEAWALLRERYGALPRAVNFVSGPSRTADIEQTLVLGAHGPSRVHIILVSQ
ncbi:MAG TPA: lactate utilization protein C [Burkholderiales bacterium]|nr:lactate utilization protein C [Burkholderiales bacterium]